jgi:GT2 family glycosyltransferase
LRQLRYHFLLRMEESQSGQAGPRVSVILVSYNDASALRTTLQSLAGSAGREMFESVVVDNGSSDDCPRMDAEFPWITLLRLPRNFGLVRALNIGMRTAKGEYYFFLTPGLEVDRDTVALLAGELDRSPQAAAVCPLAVGAGGEVLSRIHPLPLPAELQRAWQSGELENWAEPVLSGEPLEIDYFKPPVFLVRSYFLKGLRYLDERYGTAWWDLEIAAQILKASKHVLLVPAARVTARDGITAKRWPAGVRGLLAADRALGASLWCAKHYGRLPGAMFRLRATLRALAGVLTLRDPAFHWATLRYLLSGQKFDGSA